MITVSTVTNEDGFRKCQDILIEVWDLENGGNRNIIPTRLFQLSHHYGGIVLGAYNSKGDMLGFAWAFPAMDPGGNLFLFSDTAAVLEPYRDQGIGSQLKFAQRDWALRHNFSTMRWTYDPLEARNGYLNIARLGGLAHSYKRNAYGIGTSGVNKGLETDRLTLDWYLNSERVRQYASNVRKAAPPVDLPSCVALRKREGEIVPRDTNLDLKEPEFLVPLPPNIQLLKQKNMELAREWRLALRSVFETYFAQNYVLVDFHVEIVDGERRGYYRLVRNDAAPDGPFISSSCCH